MKNLLCFLLTLLVFNVNAQVLINQSSSGTPHPNASLELRDSLKGFLMNIVDSTQMEILKSTAPNGLMVFNKEKSKPFYFKKNVSKWIELNSEESKWILNPSENRVYFTPALTEGDTIYYDNMSKRFVFTDNLTYKNSLNTSFPVTSFDGKYIFKNTTSASDSARTFRTNMLVIHEVDGSNVEDSTLIQLTNLGLTTVINPQNNLKNKIIYGVNNALVNGYSDSIATLASSNNTITFRQNTGYVEESRVNENSFRITGARTQNLGNVYGTRTTLFTDNTNTYSIRSIIGNDILLSGSFFPKVTGNIYGTRLSLNAPGTKQEGKVYGLFHGNIGNEASNAQLLYSIFTNNGNNKFGDSTLISKNFLDSLPRAILDVKSTESMIIPAGSTVQRPTSTIEGQMRYNSTEKQLEFHNGTDWGGIRSFKQLVNIDVPAASGVNHNITFSGVKPGDVVVINPSNVLPGIVIAWTYVSAVDTITVRYENITGALFTIKEDMLIKAIR